MTEAPATAEALSTARQALINWKLRQRQNRLAEQDRIEPVSRDGLLPVSDQQRYLWFLSQLTPELPVYNMPAARRLQGELDEQALRNAVTELVARHESLRTRFRSEHGLPCQVIDPPAPVPIEVVDLRSLPAADRLEQATRLAEQEVRRPFDLSTGPLLRCWLARLAHDDHILLITCHHIITDGWSSRDHHPRAGRAVCRPGRRTATKEAATGRLRGLATAAARRRDRQRPSGLLAGAARRPSDAGLADRPAARQPAQLARQRSTTVRWRRA